MKPFDLEKAKKGGIVCTRDGRNARIICFDLKSNSAHEIVALIEENGTELFAAYDKKGMAIENEESPLDLMMRESYGYCAVFKDQKGILYSYDIQPEFKAVKNFRIESCDNQFFCYARVEMFYEGGED